MDGVIDWIGNNAWLSSVLGLVTAFIAGSGIFAFRRKAKSVSQGEERYLEDHKLLQPPLRRPAYSDRTAYLLAEMSALAYFPFEEPAVRLDLAAAELVKKGVTDAGQVHAWLLGIADRLAAQGGSGRQFLEQALGNAGFRLVATIDVAGTQGFVCRRNADDEPPYLIVAFRGTEKKVEDWLTDARAAALAVDGCRVHTGFYDALMKTSDGQGRTVRDIVKAVLDGPEAKGADGKPIPVFYTGHSLGGALALIAARELEDSSACACYTYGGPRVADYNYFRNMKTPVYRVVNSVDIVPRVPPGAFIGVALKAVQLLSWLSKAMPPLPALFHRLEIRLDKLNGYRHHGDLRYLTDIAPGQFDQVELLSNPPVIDQMLWMWQSIGSSLLQPVRSHGMAIYRKKLQHYANRRNS